MAKVPALSCGQNSSWCFSFPGQISGSCRKVAHLAQDAWQYIFAGKAFNILGYYCRHDKDPVDCFSSLNQLRTTTNAFESYQKNLAHFGAQPAKLDVDKNLPKQNALLAVALEPPAPSELSDAKAPPPPIEVEGKEALTNSEIKFAAENFSALGLLYYMRSSICNIHEPDSSHLQDLIRESKLARSSIWKLFIRDYGKQISWFQWIKCAFAYFLYSLIGPLTATTCSSRVVEEIRTFLQEKKNLEKSDPKKLEKFNRTLIIIIDNFCTAYKTAAENYDKANPRIGKFEDYFETAITNAVGKTLEDLQSASSQSIASHFSPEIPFHWTVRKPLNWIVSYVMKKKILPLVSRSIAEGWIRSTDRSNIPFFLAITEILTEQLLKLEQEGAQNNGEASPPPGTEELATAIRKLMYSIEISSCKDIGNGAIHGLLKRIQERENEEAKAKESGKEVSNQEDAKIRTGLEGSIVKASHVLFHYLADPKNREDLLGQFAKQLNAPFSGIVPEKTEADLTNSQNELNNTALRIFWDLCRNAVKAEVPGGIPSEIMQRLAEKVFKYEKEYLLQISDQLALFSQQMMQKVQQEYLDDKDNLFPYLIAMVDRLKELDSNREELKKQLTPLSDAGRKGIHHVLDPLFQEAKKLAKSLSEMQQTQEHHLYHRQIAKELAEISDKLSPIARNTDLDPKEHLEAIEEILSKIEAPLIPDQEGKKSPIPFLKAKFKEISSLSTSLFSHHEALKALHALAPQEEKEQKSGLIRELAAYVRRERNFSFSRGFNKRKCVNQIIEKVDLLTPDSQKELFLETTYTSQERKDLITLIKKLNNSSPYDLSFEEKIWEPLTACLRDHQAKRRREIEAHQARLSQALQDFADHVKQYSKEYDQRRKDNLAALQMKSASFHRQIVGYKENDKQVPGFQARVANLQPEAQIEIDQKRLASHLAVLGASGGAAPYETAGLLAGGYFGETFGAILGAATGFIADIGSIKFFPDLAPLARVAASAFTAVYANRQASDTTHNVKGIYEEKGNFLKNALTFKIRSRTCWGVAAAITEVGAVLGLQQFGVDPLVASLVLTTSSTYLGSRLSRTVQALEKGVEIGMNKVYPKVEATFKGAYKLLLAPENYRGLFRFAMKEFIAAYPS